jgi:hypothetical protein
MSHEDYESVCRRSVNGRAPNSIGLVVQPAYDLGHGETYNASTCFAQQRKAMALLTEGPRYTFHGATSCSTSEADGLHSGLQITKNAQLDFLASGVVFLPT